MSRYAEKTTVTTEKSRGEIEATLRRYGATGFAYSWSATRAMLAFEACERRVVFHLGLPDRAKFKLTPVTERLRSPEAQEAAYEQAVRQRWRALALVIKAKLEAVEAGISEFEDEFLAHIMLPGGQTAGDWLRPQIARAYETGQMPPLLPTPGAA